MLLWPCFASGQNREIHTADTDRLFLQQENNIHQVLLLTAILHTLGCVWVFFFLFFNPLGFSMILYVSGGIYYIFMNKSFHEEVACGALALFCLQKTMMK